MTWGQWCDDCGGRKPLAAFGQKKNGDYLSCCKSCITARVKSNREYLQRVKLERGCVDCGYRLNAAALEFDHLYDKVRNISKMVAEERGLLDAEIAKCEVVCANCHHIRTYEREREKKAQARPSLLDGIVT